MHNSVLVIGGGITGMEVSLMLANAGKKVYLVEKSPIIGGNVIKCEHVFPNLECATCMIAPKQQEVLQNPDIELLTLSEVKEVKGKVGDFKVKIHKKARYVDLVNCIGCGACYEPCPVSVKNEYEENLGERKAIYVPYAGSLPNVPLIDTDNCLRFKGEDCQACKEACMFEAINFDEKDEDIELEVDAIVVATGFKLSIPSDSKYGYGKFDDVYTAYEFERLFASNGPTNGNIYKKDGTTPKSVAIIHCVGREERGYCSRICCMYSFKFAHYIKEKIKEAKVTQFYREICTPGKSYDKFVEEIKKSGVELIKFEEIEVAPKNGSIEIKYKANGKEKVLSVEMVILSSVLEPHDDKNQFAKVLGIECDEYGFYKEKDEFEPVLSTKEGIFIAGCAQSPKDIESCVAQAQEVAGKILQLYGR